MNNNEQIHIVTLDSKFSTPSVLAFISAPEKTFVKQDANEILSAEGEQFN